MILCLDVGNTTLHGGVFHDGEMAPFLQFRKGSSPQLSSDEWGLFLRSILRENGLDPSIIRAIAIGSVVPGSLYSLGSGCLKYFEISPFFLQAGVKTGLNIRYRDPLEVGADRIANAIAASTLYPNEDLIIIDFGTATTFCAVSKDKEYLGGVIIAGIRISMEALESRTAKLPTVEIVPRTQVLGRTTVESIQSGLYYGHAGQVNAISQRLSEEIFSAKKPKRIATGGFSALFENTGIFDIAIPDLVLRGLLLAWRANSLYKKV